MDCGRSTIGKLFSPCTAFGEADSSFYIVDPHAPILLGQDTGFYDPYTQAEAVGTEMLIMTPPGSIEFDGTMGTAWLAKENGSFFPAAMRSLWVDNSSDRRQPAIVDSQRSSIFILLRLPLTPRWRRYLAA